MSENKTAMRDANGIPVFVKTDGSYSEEFPPELIVRRGEGAFIVYGFVGSNSDYEEQGIAFETESEAIEYATDLYGQENPDGFEREGEVFEVEVHEVDEEEAATFFRTQN